MIQTVVVGHGLAGRAFHCPLIRRQTDLSLHGIVARDPRVRAEGVALWGVRGYASLDEALEDPAVELVVLATPHNTHAELAVRALDSGRHCVVDKVMALTTEEADRMIAARDRSGRMLSVFHNRRWDWDFATIRDVLAQGLIGRPLLVESSVCRHSAPRSWRGRAEEAGTILHDWGATPGGSRASARPGTVPAAGGLGAGESLGGSRQRRPRADHHGVRPGDLPGGDQPHLPDRPAAVVDRRDRRGVRQVWHRPPGRRAPRRRHRPGDGAGKP